MQRLNLNQIAKEYGKSAKTFRGYVRELRIPHIRLGREMLFDPTEVEKYLEEMTRAQLQPEPDIKAKPVKRHRTTKRSPDVSRYSAMLEL